MDPATLLVSAETATPVATDPTATGEPVSDIFAALLSALAPSAPAPEQGTSPAPEGEPDTSSGQPQPGHLLATLGQTADAAPQVMVGGAGPTGAFEVQRDSRGLPLLATATATPMAAAGLAVPRSELPAEPDAAVPADAEAGTGSAARPSTPTTTELPAAAAVVLGGGPAVLPRVARRVVPVGSGVTTVSSDPQHAPLDGRPVPTTPEIGSEAAPKPGQIPVPPPVDDAEIKAEAGTKPDIVKPGATGGAETYAPSTEAAAPGTGPEPRPAVWQPELGSTPSPSAAINVTAGAAAAEPAPIAPLQTATPHTTAEPAMQRPADPQQIQAQVLRQVLGRFDAADGRPQQITLQLNPEHLGKVEVRLTTIGGQLQVEFQAETAEAGVALREGQHELVRSLTTQAGRWQQVEIKVSEPASPATKTDDQEEERSEQGSRRERDHQQRRRQRGDR